MPQISDKKGRMRSLIYFAMWNKEKNLGTKSNIRRLFSRIPESEFGFKVKNWFKP